MTKKAERIVANYREMHGLPEPAPISETAILERIAAMMGEFVDNWPRPKRIHTALALVAKTLRAALPDSAGRPGKPELVEQMRLAREADTQQLHTITLAVKRMRQMKAALQECEAYFEERAEAEYSTESASPSGNEEMQLLVEVQQAIAGLPQVSA